MKILMDYRRHFAQAAKHKRSGVYQVGNAAMIVMITGLLILGAMVAGILKFSSSGPTGSGTPSTCLNNYSPPLGYSCTSLPLAESLVDPLGAVTQSSVTIKLYQGLSVVDSVTTGSGGTATSQGTYSTGQALVAYFTGASNFVTLYQPFVVPPIPTGQSGLTTISVPFFDVKLGSGTPYSLLVQGSGGTTFTSGNTYQWAAQPSTTSTTITVSITEGTNNQGYKTSYDITNSLTQYLVLEASDGASGTETINSAQFFNKVGTTSYWQWILPDGISQNYANGPSVGSTPTDASGRLFAWQVNPSQTTNFNGVNVVGSASLQAVGTNAVGGTVTVQFTLNKGSLGATSTCTITLTVKDYYSPYYFAINGNGGPNVASVSSAFTLVMHG